MQQVYTSLARLRSTVISSVAFLFLSLLLAMAPAALRAQAPGGGLAFDGVDDYIEVPDAASLHITDALTVEMWVNTTTAANAVLLEKSNNNTSYGLQLNAGKVLFFVSPNAATGQLQSNGAVNDGQWHHIAGTYNHAANTMYVYIDGVLDNTATTKTDAVTPNTQSLLIGSRSGTLAFAGQMDEVRIWSRDLCAGEIQNNKNCELQAGSSGLAAVYHLDAGVAGGYNAGTTVPGAPAITTVTTSDGQATIAFIPPVSNGGLEITAYTATSNPGSISVSSETSPIVVTGLTDGQPYTFSVTAINDAGASDPSAPSSPVTPLGVPSAPAILSVTPGDGQVTVAFNAPASNGGLLITQYRVTSIPDSQFGEGISSPITVTGLTNGQTYSFTVFAENARGIGPSSPSSNNVTPTGPPGAPTITAVTAADGQATVSFQAPTNTGGLPVLGYTVISNPDGITATGASSPLTVNGLTNGQAYTFTVEANNAAGTGPASAPYVNGVVPVGAPSAPTITGVQAGDGSATVTFSAPTNNGGSFISLYTITSAPGGIVATGSTSPITVTGLVDGQSYTFTMIANNEVKNSVNSDVSSPVVPVGPPSPPTITITQAGDAQVTVAFSVSTNNGGLPITQYTITSSPSGITASGSSSPIVVTGLTNGTPYTFTATAANAAGTSDPSAPSNSPVTPLGVPLAPSINSVTPGNGQVSIDFNEPSGDGGSNITQYTVTGIPGGIIAVGNSSPLVVTGLTNGQAYTFTIYAVNAQGAGPASPSSNAVTPIGPPGAPTITTVTAADGQATVSFQASTNTGGLPVLEYTVTSIPGGLTATGASSPVTVNGLTDGQSYTFTVQAQNAAGTGPASAPSVNGVVPLGPPAPPNITNVLSGDGSVTVTFSAPTNNGGSSISFYTVTSSPGGIVATGTTSPIVVTGLINGQTYTFTATASNAVGTSGNSPASVAVVPVGLPGAPVITIVSPGNGLATVSFNTPDNTGGLGNTLSYSCTSNPGGFTFTNTHFTHCCQRPYQRAAIYIYRGCYH